PSGAERRKRPPSNKRTKEQPTHVLSSAWQGKGEDDVRRPAASEWFRPNAGRPKQQTEVSHAATCARSNRLDGGIQGSVLHQRQRARPGQRSRSPPPEADTRAAY